MWICTVAPHLSILSVIGVAARETKTRPLDHVDVTARAETMNTVPTQPVMLQIGVVPAYALTAPASAQHKLAPRLHRLRVYTKLACIPASLRFTRRRLAVLAENPLLHSACACVSRV